MRSRSLVEFGQRALGLLPAGASAAAEGAWVAIVYAAVQTGLGHEPPNVGLWTFVAAAAVGIAVARIYHGRGSRLATAIIIGFAGLVGWLSDPAVRGLVGAGSVGPAIGQHGPGWLLGLGAWRGSRHADLARDDLVSATLLSWVVPGLAIPWLVGTTSPDRAAFIDIALPATLVFVASSLIAVGLTRLDALGHSSGVDWRRNRTWIVLLIGVVALVVALGTPTALLLGIPIERMLAVVVGPLGVLANGVRAVLGPVAGAITGAIGPVGTSGTGASPSVASPDGSGVVPIPGWVATVLAVAVGIGLVVAAFRLRRLVIGAPMPIRWRGTRSEERHVRLPVLAIRTPGLRLPRFGPLRARRPKTGAAAYLALLRELEGTDQLARDPTESPAAHARRLRAAGLGWRGLDLLAADFQLERYAGVTLTRLEVARAIRRWRAGRPRGRRLPIDHSR